jgi:hypothetical protein
MMFFAVGDERIRLMAELLAGMKLIKLYGLFSRL